MKWALVVTVAAALAAGALGGCTKPRTEMVVVVQTEGVRIPIDIHKLHLTVQDRAATGDDIVYEQDVELCREGLTTNCYELPVSAVLFPGNSHPNDTVRVQVDAIGMNEQKVIADAAVFTFADEQSLRLDFVLYANCIGNVECQKRDQTCGPLDQCVSINPVGLHGDPDLALQAPEDFAVPEVTHDMTVRDLAGADLFTAPPDLTTIIDMSGCANVSCSPTQICVSPGVCTSCGNYQEPCCAAPTMACSQTNLACNGASCEQCGQPGQLCCANDVCFSGVCDTGSGRCVPQSPSDFAIVIHDDLGVMMGGSDLF